LARRAEIGSFAGPAVRFSGWSFSATEASNSLSAANCRKLRFGQGVAHLSNEVPRGLNYRAGTAHRFQIVTFAFVLHFQLVSFEIRHALLNFLPLGDRPRHRRDGSSRGRLNLCLLDDNQGSLGGWFYRRNRSAAHALHERHRLSD
jgi:hypothetical protein